MKTKKTDLQISNHILPTASNLLGLCFLLMSFIKINHMSKDTYLDECLVVPILFFFLASIFSYLSLRSDTRFLTIESWADKMFMLGLFSMTLISGIFIFEIFI